MTSMQDVFPLEYIFNCETIKYSIAQKQLSTHLKVPVVEKRKRAHFAVTPNIWDLFSLHLSKKTIFFEYLEDTEDYDLIKNGNWLIHRFYYDGDSKIGDFVLKESAHCLKDMPHIVQFNYSRNDDAFDRLKDLLKEKDYDSVLDKIDIKEIFINTRFSIEGNDNIWIDFSSWSDFGCYSTLTLDLSSEVGSNFLPQFERDFDLIPVPSKSIACLYKDHKSLFDIMKLSKMENESAKQSIPFITNKDLRIGIEFDDLFDGMGLD